MINFRVVRWKNFLSTGNVFTEVKLDKSKSTLIVGQNGAGKSTILDAISFALYNKPFRKINKPQLINSINNKDAVVEIEFSVGRDSYKVVRGIKPNIFEIYKNDLMFNQDSANRDYQEFLEKTILKLNHRSFSQVVVLGSSTYVPFMQLPASQRREVIEDLLDIQIFTSMNNMLKEKVAVNKTEVADAKYAADLCSEKITMEQKYLASVRKDKDSRIEANKLKIKEIAKTIVELRESIKDYQRDWITLELDLSDENQVLEKANELSDNRVRLFDRMFSLEKEIKFFHDNENCPTCKQGIDHDFKESAVSSKKDTLASIEEELRVIDLDQDQVTARLNEIKDTRQAMIKVNEHIKVVTAQIESEKRNYKALETENASLAKEQDTTESTATLLALKEELAEIEAKREALSRRNAVLSAASALLKDGGIKTKIIRQYIPIMNKLINKYLAAMDFFVHFELDEQFNEKIKSRFRDEFSYNSFSEGEKMRINLAVLFTWRAIAKMRNSATTNLLIMDEVFDSSLDGVGTDEFLKILNNLTADNNTFIISHKGDALYDKFHSIIKFEKQGNFSRMV
jgi:DNA repair exonuclease SbcCD ATPase subunit